jgi:hypothetical protein
MPTKHPIDTNGSPVPGLIPDPVHPVHEPSPRSDPGAEREARRQARDERRGAPAERPGVMIPNRRKRLPLEAPLMRVIATAGIVAIAVVVAAIMSSQGSAGWMIGLVASVVSLILAAGLWSSRRL